MRLIRRYRAIAAWLCLFALLSGCNDDAAKRLNEAAHAIGLVQQFAIDAEKQKLMTTAEAKTVVTATLKLSESGKAAVAVMRGINLQDPASRTKAIDAIGLVADQLGQLQKTLNIQNDTSRRHVESLLLLVQTSLNAARISIAAQE